MDSSVLICIINKDLINKIITQFILRFVAGSSAIYSNIIGSSQSFTK